MKKKIVVANWKMNPGEPKLAEKIFSKIKRIASRVPTVSVVVCPPNVYLQKLSTDSKKSRVEVGVQDIFYEEAGAYTGEVGSLLAKNSGARYALVGHSERRRIGDTDPIVAKKVFAGLRAGLFIILCVGESSRDDHGVYLAHLHDQLMSALSKVTTKMVQKLIIAYEPIWAIGKSEQDAITPRDLHEMIIYIRKVLSDRFGLDAGSSVRVIYGGSVFPKNAKSFLTEGMAEGLLVGRESLIPESFELIIKSAS